jgi:hypothetical protein
MSPSEQQLLLASGQLVTLNQAAQDTPYSPEYLSLRARQGKLKAVKLGRDWMTTRDIVRAYVCKQRERQAQLYSKFQSFEKIHLPKRGLETDRPNLEAGSLKIKMVLAAAGAFVSALMALTLVFSGQAAVPNTVTKVAGQLLAVNFQPGILAELNHEKFVKLAANGKHFTASNLTLDQLVIIHPKGKTVVVGNVFDSGQVLSLSVQNPEATNSSSGLTRDDVLQLIYQQIQNYLAQNKLPQSLSAAPALPPVVTYMQPVPQNNFYSGSLAGFTALSGGSIVVNTTFTSVGSATFSGAAIFNGTATLATTSISSLTAPLTIQGTGSANLFTVASSTGATLFTITPTGNVGIGTTNPAYKLDVNGSVRGDNISYLELFRNQYLGGITSLSNGGSLKSGNLPRGATTSTIVDDTRFCRFPGISRLPNGNLVVVYHCETGDNYGEGHNGGIYQKISTDQGQSWSAETTIYSPPDGTGALVSGLTLLSNGKLILMWENYGPGNTYPLMMMKGTAGASNTISWGTPTTITSSCSFSSGNCYVSAKILELANGTLMLPVYGANNSNNIWTTAVLISTDGGTTWGNQVTIAAGASGTPTHSYSEPNLVQLADGTIVAIMRDDDEAHGNTPIGYARAYSTDNGVTWSSPSTVISSQHPGTPAITLLGSGGIFLMTRGAWAGQTGYVTSWDSGATWTSFSYVPTIPTWGDVYDSVTLLSGGVVAAAVSWQNVGSSSATIRYVDFYDGNGLFPGGFIKASQLTVGTTSLSSLLTLQGTSSMASLLNITSSTGTSVLYVSNNGNVGIGTTSPISKLDVWGNLNVATSSTPTLFVSPANSFVGINTTTSASTFTIQGTGAINPFTIASSTGSTLFTITPSGNVGIGTTTPSYDLHLFKAGNVNLTVESSGVANPGVSIIADPSQGGRKWSLGATIALNTIGGPKFTISDDTVTESPWWMAYRLVIDGSGNVGIRAPWPSNRLDVGGAVAIGTGYAGTAYPGGVTAPTNGMIIQGNVGIGTTTPDAKLTVTGVSTSPTAVLFNVASSTYSSLFNVQSSGNVGIGTTSPSQKLHVVGDILLSQSISDVFMGGNSQGNTVLRTDGGNTFHILGWGGRDIAHGGPDPYNQVCFGCGSYSNVSVGIGGGNDGGGSLGVGTMIATSSYAFFSPGDVLLHIKALSGGATSRLIFGSDTASAAGVINRNVASQNIFIGENNDTGNFIIRGTGNVGIGTTSPTASLFIQGTSTTPILSIISSTTAQSLFVANNGNVGIGTTAPTKSLDISKDFVIDDGIRLLDSDGGYFQVTQSTAVAGAFQPILQGYATGNSMSALVFKALQTTGTAPANGAIRFIVRDSTDSTAIGATNLAFRFDNNNTTALAILGGGNVGIGTTSPTASLFIQGTSTTPMLSIISSTTAQSLYVANNGKVGIGTSSPLYLLHVGSAAVSGIVARFENSTGSCDINPTTSTLVCPSDIRLKKNITTMQDALGKVLGLRSVLYNWKNEEATSTPHPGFIAQEVEAIMPELVYTDQNGYKSLGYSNFIPFLVAALQEQQQQIMALQGSLGQNLSASTLTISQPVVYEGLVTFKRPVNFSADNVGQAKILAGATSVRISFSIPYEYQPIVTVTPLGKDVLALNLKYAVDDVDSTGFTIYVMQSFTTDVIFDWHAFASPDAKLAVSDGSAAPIILVVANTTPSPSPASGATPPILGGEGSGSSPDAGEDNQGIVAGTPVPSSSGGATGQASTPSTETSTSTSENLGGQASSTPLADALPLANQGDTATSTAPNEPALTPAPAVAEGTSESASAPSASAAAAADIAASAGQ